MINFGKTWLEKVVLSNNLSHLTSLKVKGERQNSSLSTTTPPTLQKKIGEGLALAPFRFLLEGRGRLHTG